MVLKKSSKYSEKEKSFVIRFLDSSIFLMLIRGLLPQKKFRGEYFNSVLLGDVLRATLCNNHVA
jgi:hypothetical protein